MARTVARQVAALERHKTFLDFTRDDLGADLLKIATDGVLETIAAEQTPDGTRWDELTEDYARWKADHYAGKPMGHLDEIMADPDEVAGVPEITETTATVRYGKTDAARQHAEWFSARRPFWGFTEASRAAAKARVAKRFKEVVRG